MIINFINSPAFKKGLNIALAMGSGVAAVTESIANQKKEREFKNMQKTVSELQKTVSELQKNIK